MLKRVLKEKIVDSLRKVSGYKILVVDEEALRVLDSCLKMSQVLSEGVLTVEGIFKKRQRQEEKVAVYLISSTLTSVQALIADFGRHPLYKACHVFCLSTLSDSLFDMIKTSNLKRFIGNLIELNIDFTAPDPNFFSLDIPESYYSIYGSSQESLLDYDLQTMAQKIVSLLQNLGEYPHIRYSTKPQAFSTTPHKSLSYRLALLLDKELERLCRRESTFPNPDLKRGILIITDRSIDVLSCLLHDVHYQSILTDLLPVHSQKYKDGGKEVVLDETDFVYMACRRLHIGDVTEYVTTTLDGFTKTNQAAQYEVHGSRGGEIEELKGIMESFQDYAVMKECLARHVNLCLRVSKVYEERRLERIVELEQDLVTVWREDKAFKKVLREIDLILVDSGVEYYDKVRLMLLVVIAQEGVGDTDRANLLELVRCDMADIQALTNLGLLNVKLSPALDKRGDNNPYGIEQVSKRNSRRTVKFENDKWVPALSFIVEDQINNQLDSSWFPWLKEPPAELNTVERSRIVSDSSSNSGFGSLFKKREEVVVQPVQPTRKKPSWATRKSGQSQTSSEPVAYSPVTPIREIQSPAVDLGPRVMVFMIGGATFSELRCMSDLEQKHSRQVLLGSTHTWTPDSFVESLKDLGKRNVQGSQFYGFHRPPDPRIRRRRGGDDVPPRPREEPPRPRVARDRSGSGSSSSRREAGSSRRETSGSRRDIPPRPERRSPPGSPPRRPSSNRSRQEPLPEEFDRLNVRGDSGQRGSEGSRDRSAGGNEKKRGWFSKS